MKIHRFIGPYNFNQNTIRITDQETVRQMKTVLKLTPGETVILSDGKGMEAEIVIELIHKTEVTGGIVSKRLIDIAHDAGVALYLAILKKENFELAVQKATECGVSKVVPVITERTVKTGLNMERLNKIIREAAEQCGQSLLPEILSPMQFDEALIHGQNSKEKVIFHLSGENYNPGGAPSGVQHIGNSYVSVFIGPEGGFTEPEITQAKNMGYDVASLGPLTLRGETAAIVATYRAVQGV